MRRPRCSWAQTPLSIAYHDAEWGSPVHDDRVHFEFLILEGAQAGLSWETILKKRENYRKAFAGFDPVKVARFTDRRIERLMNDAGIVRNRLKIGSAVTNARAFLATQREFGSFDAFVWSFVDGVPRVNRPRSLRQVPVRTSESDALSKALAKRGFKFVGSTITPPIASALDERGLEMKKMIPAASPDAYVDALDGWRRTIVETLRSSVRSASGLEEVVKWGHLVYLAKGPVLLIRAEDRRVLFGFWRGQRLRAIEPRLKPGGKYEMATLEIREGMTVKPATARRLAREAVALDRKLGSATLAARSGKKARPS